ncbi:hypothetical protein LAZ67_13002183 [Cordylochernes scorpioides]|uniref:Mos1 transposase HTH domain-containing protein n=1 Tax=Cordylochernes scorpioides TaxID=51811 RepID=A0ABY6L4E5_9ARAC|nr:hypothetical protein LAZ67_13002183 [Cordylochernes scorpioides]
MLINGLTLGHEFIVHQSLYIKEEIFGRAWLINEKSFQQFILFNRPDFSRIELGFSSLLIHLPRILLRNSEMNAKFVNKGLKVVHVMGDTPPKILPSYVETATLQTRTAVRIHTEIDTTKDDTSKLCKRCTAMYHRENAKRDKHHQRRETPPSYVNAVPQCTTERMHKEINATKEERHLQVIMECFEKQRVCIEVCFKLGKTASESFQMLKQAFKEDALSQSRTFEWFARFKAVTQVPGAYRNLSIRKPENALKIKSSIKENPRITIRELSEDLDISFVTCQTIIKNDLHFKRSPAKFFPHLLTNEQKDNLKETCKNMVEMFNYDPHWLKIVITEDETWVYGYDPETKRQSSQWLEPGEPRFKKARMIKSKLKCLLITFFDVKGLVHYKFVPEGQIINQHYYLDVLRHLREAVRQKRPEK